MWVRYELLMIRNIRETAVFLLVKWVHVFVSTTVVEINCLRTRRACSSKLPSKNVQCHSGGKNAIQVSFTDSSLIKQSFPINSIGVKPAGTLVANVVEKENYSLGF